MIVDPASLYVDEDMATAANQHQTVLFFSGNEQAKDEVKRAA